MKWTGEAVKRRAMAASRDAIDATMSAAILHAKAGHLSGAHASRRFETQTGELERSLRITRPARRVAKGVVAGRWGSTGVNYARRIEYGFQGADSLGRVVDAPAYPFLQPAADAEYPKLQSRVARAFRGRSHL